MNDNLHQLQFRFKTANLPPSLGIRYRSYADQLEESRNARNSTQRRDEGTIDSSTPVYTSQQSYDPKQVMHYVKTGSMQSTDDYSRSDKPLLNEYGNGNLWHQDGLHRMIASRLNQQQFPAEIQRRDSWDD